ncbi:PEP-CTERM sorting domain-containing protein [Methylophilus sp. 5]|uniref:PEP-CTERM sorting domain-containing protein n=1 Tax=Methylophilus sp. 5 TaxID=1112274 RepID=UPI00048DD5A0|nr:PEP-CTERM sorting domain-containing protein [Methylophilus sp. 5]
MRFLNSLIFSLAMLVSVSSHAAVETYGELLSGTYEPGADFASLSVSNTGNVYTFTLSAYDLNALFTNKAFIGSIAVKATPDVSAGNITISNISGGVTSLTAGNGGGPGGGWDFRFVLGQGQDRLLANESITWTATFASASQVTLDDYALHVQGLTKAQGDSAWYLNSIVTTPVPEPASSGMVLAGLAFVFGMRKRLAHV